MLPFFQQRVTRLLKINKEQAKLAPLERSPGLIELNQGIIKRLKQWDKKERKRQRDKARERNKRGKQLDAIVSLASATAEVVSKLAAGQAAQAHFEAGKRIKELFVSFPNGGQLSPAPHPEEEEGGERYAILSGARSGKRAAMLSGWGKDLIDPAELKKLKVNFETDEQFNERRRIYKELAKAGIDRDSFDEAVDKAGLGELEHERGFYVESREKLEGGEVINLKSTRRFSDMLPPGTMTAKSMIDAGFATPEQYQHHEATKGEAFNFTDEEEIARIEAGGVLDSERGLTGDWVVEDELHGGTPKPLTYDAAPVDPQGQYNALVDLYGVSVRVWFDYVRDLDKPQYLYTFRKIETVNPNELLTLLEYMSNTFATQAHYTAHRTEAGRAAQRVLNEWVSLEDELKRLLWPVKWERSNQSRTLRQ